MKHNLSPCESYCKFTDLQRTGWDLGQMLLVKGNVHQLPSLTVIAMGVNSYLTELASWWYCDISCVTSEVEECVSLQAWSLHNASRPALTSVSHRGCQRGPLHHRTQQTHYTRGPEHESFESYVRRDLQREREKKRERERERQKERNKDSMSEREQEVGVI